MYSWMAVTRRWIDTLGWFNYPGCITFCQDTIVQNLAEALGRIKRIDQVALWHDTLTGTDLEGKIKRDAERYLWFMAKDYGRCLNKLRKAMCVDYAKSA